MPLILKGPRGSARRCSFSQRSTRGGGEASRAGQRLRIASSRIVPGRGVRGRTFPSIRGRAAHGLRAPAPRRRSPRARRLLSAPSASWERTRARPLATPLPTPAPIACAASSITGTCTAASVLPRRPKRSTVRMARVRSVTHARASGRVDVEVGAAGDEDGHGSDADDGLCARDERKRGRDDLVARADALGPEAAKDGVAPGRHTDGVRDAELARHLALERLDLVAEDELPGVDQARQTAASMSRRMGACSRDRSASLTCASKNDSAASTTAPGVST